jgi:hypothetical protein
VADRPALAPDVRGFLQDAIDRLGRLSVRLRSLGVAEELLLAWRDGVLVPLEREAARARRHERVRSRLRGPLPTTVVEERLLARVAAIPEGRVVARERAELLDELDRLLAEVRAEGAGLDVPQA